MHNQSEQKLPETYIDRGNQTEFYSVAIWNSSRLIGRRGSIGITIAHILYKKKHQHKWLVIHLTFSDEFDALYSYFTSSWDSAESDSSYRSEVGIISSVYII